MVELTFGVGEIKIKFSGGANGQFFCWCGGQSPPPPIPPVEKTLSFANVHSISLNFMQMVLIGSLFETNIYRIEFSHSYLVFKNEHE